MNNINNVCHTHCSEEITQVLKLGLIGLVCCQLSHTGLQTLVPIFKSAHLLQSLYGLRIALSPNADPGQWAARHSAQSPVGQGLMWRRNLTREIYTSCATCTCSLILDRATKGQRVDGYGVFNGGDGALQPLGMREGMSFTQLMPSEAENENECLWFWPQFVFVDVGYAFTLSKSFIQVNVCLNCSCRLL